ncbi:MAG: hypothetical protein L3J87_02740 [Thermoplasmata archaeon]|nr:hypothetical protein [Thermoplasmata archaeon]
MATPVPSAFRTPYTLTPGGSTPGPQVAPAEGRKDLREFFWLSLANTAIISVAGIATWLLIR